MAYPRTSITSFIIGILVLAYLSTFILFAIIRILTGISIQRLWWSGLRHISFTPKEGVRVTIRGLRLSLHRPTFARPTWLSVVITECKVIVDLQLLGSKSAKRLRWARWSKTSTSQPAQRLRTPDNSVDSPTSEPDSDSDDVEEQDPRSRTWERLTEMKEQIKRLHRKIRWIRLVDVVATNTALVIEHVGVMEVTSLTMAVDTRRKLVDRSRLFKHRRPRAADQAPAEWIFTARSILFSPEGKDSVEILDHATFNIYGILHQKLEGLRDASIALKLGRVSIPYDDLQGCVDKAKEIRAQNVQPRTEGKEASSLGQITDELEKPGSQQESLVRTVADSKEFVASTLRGIQEVQFAVGFLGLTKRIKGIDALQPVYANMAMKEVSFDLLRLEQSSPAHLMYFSRKDVAHQALITAISIGVGIDDGFEHPERLLYVPMATATLRTTLPSKTIQFSSYKEKEIVAERNTNILSANLVVTSPSVDLDPKHLPLMLAILEKRMSKEKSERPKTPNNSRRQLFSTLLPKATVRVSINEPVLRVSLPSADEESRKAGDSDLLISSMSSMSLDIDSSHTPDGDSHYSLAATYRVNSHHFYYQTAGRDKHDLLLTDVFEVKLQVHATPELSVMASVNPQTFNVYMVRPEICDGVKQIMTHLQQDTFRHQLRAAKKRPQGPTILRKLPSWLLHVEVHGTNFNLYVAGHEPEISEDPRGVALHLEDWTAEYKANRADETPRPVGRRRIASRSSDDMFSKPGSPSPSRRRPDNETDNRRLAIHLKGFEALILESLEHVEDEKFMSLPQFEVALSTSTDYNGPLMHVNAYARRVYIHYSLARHYAIGLATSVIRRTFSRPKSRPPTPNPQDKLSPLTKFDGRPNSPLSKVEVITYDFGAGLIQVKADMPADPRLMLQIFDVKVGRHRSLNPFVKAHLIRLYADAPKVKGIWARIVSLRNPKVELRTSKRQLKTGGTSDEHSIDVNADAIRLGVPHGLVVHKIFDNCTNVVKTVAQLHHRFSTGTDEYILEKHPEGPKHVPKLSLHTRSLLFEVEDSDFEWKLGLIYLQGAQEQKQRLAREHAYELKVQRIEEADAARARALKKQPTNFQQPGRGRNHKRRVSEEATFETRASSPQLPKSEKSRSHSPRKRQLIYDREGTCNLSDSAKRSIEDARKKADEYNAVTWKRRIQAAYSFQEHRIRDLRSIVWGMDEHPDSIEQLERILDIPQRPSLLAVLISDVTMKIDKPSFNLDKVPDFLHKMGKGMPLDMQYGLLVPMSLDIAMGETRALLRDYPLPFLHIPALKSGQSARKSSWQIKTDFVIAEEFRNKESIRDVRVTVVKPHEKSGGKKHGGLVIDVLRTVSAVKTYSDFEMEINTNLPTRITWGSSYQPAIQDVMQVIESFTKPPVDPSERVGFWDKIRLSFHSRFNIRWKGNGDVHLVLKGLRDPYSVTGSGAGFVMCWRGDVHWQLRPNPDPKQFMIVDSTDYVLAVPDFNQYARRDLHKENSDDSSMSSAAYSHAGRFKKTMMKLSGKVRWQVGMMFERNALEKDKRSFEFKPHWEVALKNPKYAKATDDHPYDAFRGFRSNHIHLSIAVISPMDRDWTVTNVKPTKNYNSIHLSPRSFTHFFDWWAMFSGNMSLPVRQGKLWSGPEKSSKKFGRHLATIKYNLLLSPLFISHVYKHKDPEDFSKNVVSSTGLKCKLDSFMLDMHQRREEFRQPVKDTSSKESKTTGMRINQCQLDLVAADFRAITQEVKGTSSSDLDQVTDETLASYEESKTKVDLSSFVIPDQDTAWVDMDDYVELDWILPTEANPRTEVLPLAFAPRFTYFRQTDHHGVVHGDPMRTSHFGYEDTHNCVMTEKNDPRRVQCDLIQERLEGIADQIDKARRAVGEQELKVIREPTVTELSNTGERKKSTQKLKFEKIQQRQETLYKKQKFLQAMHKVLLSRLDSNDPRPVPDLDSSTEDFFEAHEAYDPHDPELLGMDSVPLGEDISDFNNRFIVHNAQLKWNNGLRDVILRYFHQVSQRRGFVYYMSRKAVKTLLDIVEEQRKKRSGSTATAPDNDGHSSTEPMSRQQTCGTNGTNNTDSEIQERIQQLMQDGKDFVTANDAEEKTEEDSGPKKSTSVQHHAPDTAKDEISEEFSAQNSYHVRLVAPQIQMQSHKNIKAAVVIAAKSMQLKVIQIMDKERMNDEVSGLVQRRVEAAMDALQIFIANERHMSPEWTDLYSANKYGTKNNSFWPPWLPLEAMFDFHIDPVGFSRVVQRTSASMRYDKFNKLRLKYNDDVSNEEGSDSSNKSLSDDRRMDRLWVDFPQLLAKLNSTQYYALYMIVLDLLIYSEPLGKNRADKLEKIMLASDFSDLSDAPTAVIKLQEKLRTMYEIKAIFQINEKTLSRRQWKERIALDHEITTAEEELFFIMTAITTAQRKRDDRTTTSQAYNALRWNVAADSIVWHLVQGRDEQSLVELQLSKAQFHRTDISDGSNQVDLEIGGIEGYNLLPNALYPQIIAPFHEDDKQSVDENRKMIQVKWLMLEAIGGIPVVQDFTVDIFPMRVQLEREVGDRVFEYIFPGYNRAKGESGGFQLKALLPSHLEEEEEDDNEEAVSGSSSPTLADTPTHELADGHGHGDLSLRLQPTLTMPAPPVRGQLVRANTGKPNDQKESSRFKSAFSRDKFRRDGPSESTVEVNRPKAVRTQSSISVSSTRPKDLDNPRKFALHRTNSEGSQSSKHQKKSEQSQVGEMMRRSGAYMSLTHVKISSTILCVSYKGKGTRNYITDMHDFAFRMPLLEWNNKTWSNLDLVAHIKRELLKSLLAHTGSLIGNKFHSRLDKSKASRLRDLASSSVILGSNSSRQQSASSSTVINSRPDSSNNSSSRNSHDRVGDGAEDLKPRPQGLDMLDMISESESDYSRPSEEHEERPSFNSNDRGSEYSSQYPTSSFGTGSSSARSARSLPRQRPRTQDSTHRSNGIANGNGKGHPRPKTAESSTGRSLSRVMPMKGRSPAELYDLHQGVNEVDYAQEEDDRDGIEDLATPTPNDSPAGFGNANGGTHKDDTIRQAISRRLTSIKVKPSEDEGGKDRPGTRPGTGEASEGETKHKGRLSLARFLPNRHN